MATPQESTTTVSGKRCTRSRARTAATSALTSSEPAVTPTELTSTTTEAAPQQQTSAAQAPPPPPPPPPPPSSSAQDAQQVSPTEAASSAIGTSSVVSSSVAQPSALANLEPSPPAAVAPGPAPEVNESQAVASVAAAATTAPATTPAPTSSDSIPIAATSASLLISQSQPQPSEATSDPASQSSVAALPEQPGQSVLPSDPSSDTQPEEPQSTETGVPAGGSAGGVISPDQGTPAEPNGLTIPADGQTNVASIAGGVVGGFVGIALISALLFICLRRRKTGTFGKWQQRMSEKSQGDGGFMAKLKAVPDKLKAIPAGFTMFVSKIKGKKSGPTSNPYRRHSVRSSVSSVYSVRSQGRSRSISEPPSKFQFRQQLRGFGDRMPSLKRSRTLLQRNKENAGGSPFQGIVEDPVTRNSKNVDNPFKDPEEQPRDLLLLNPDPDMPGTQKTRFDGLQDQQRGPITPKPAATSERSSRDPFASILDELEERNGSGTPEWLRDPGHKRTGSAQTALRSHPPSNYTSSVYTTAENPFFDPTDAPPVPTNPLPPNPPARPANAYAPLPAFNATSSSLSRESNTSFFFGEPGPSRPTTNMFTKVRQSDPFDLDRPEVLGFGNVGGRTIRASVTRQNSRNRRSSVPNWVNVDDGPYERASAMPGPLRKPSVRR